MRRIAAPRRRALRLAAVAGAALVAATLLPAPRARAADEVPISDAEKLLFMTNHLARIGPHQRLRYRFSKNGSLEAGFKDSVEVDVVADDGETGKQVDVRFLPKQAGAMSPSLPHVEGNPVLLLFLERQIHELARLTGGRPDYFQRRIRAALAERARISEATVRVGGQSVAVKRIEISPYVDDPNRSRFEKFATASYAFVLGDGVPGAVYQLEAHLPPGGPAPLLDEVLTFDGEQKVR